MGNIYWQGLSPPYLNNCIAKQFKEGLKRVLLKREVMSGCKNTTGMTLFNTLKSQ